jgi:hypothetical protein
MCGKGFKVAQGLWDFITAGHGYDSEVAIITMSGDGQYILRAANVPRSRERINQYYRHHNDSKNVSGILKIRTKYSIAQLKHHNTSFKKYC